MVNAICAFNEEWFVILLAKQKYLPPHLLTDQLQMSEGFYHIPI